MSGTIPDVATRAGRIEETQAAARPTGGVWMGVAALLLTATLWSLNGFSIKVLTNDHVSPWTIGFFRSLIGGLTLLPLAYRGMRGAVSEPAWCAASIVAFSLMTTSFVLSTTLTTAANAIVLMYTSPLWVFLLSPVLLGERPSWRDGASLLLCLVGVGVIFIGNLMSGASDTKGMSIAVFGGVAQAFFLLATRRLRGLGPLVVPAINMLGASVLLFAPMIAWGGVAISAKAWIMLFFLATVQYALPFALLAYGFAHVPAVRGSLIILLETLLNPLFTYFVVREVPHVSTFVGGPLILAGVAGWTILGHRRFAAERAALRVRRD